MRAGIAIAALAGLTAAANAATDIRIYSIDRFTNSLVTVDPADASVTVVGPITGLPGIIVDLEYVSGRLFGVVRNGARLVELNPATAEVLLNVPLTADGSPVINAIEGLGARDDGTLLLSYWSPNAANTSSSNTVGVVSLTGAVTAPANFGPAADYDGLARLPGSGDKLIGIDREPGTQNVRFFELDTAGPTATLVYDIPFFPVGSLVFDNVNEIAIVGDIWYGLDLNTRKLHAIQDAGSGNFFVSSLNYDPTYRLGEIAVRAACSRADLNGDGVMNFADVQTFIQWFNAGDGRADIDGNGAVNFADAQEFITTFQAGC